MIKMYVSRIITLTNGEKIAKPKLEHDNIGNDGTDLLVNCGDRLEFLSIHI